MNKQEKIDRIKKWLGSGTINIFGRPLSGKDVQGQRLAKTLNGSLVGGGDILRNSTMPEHVRGYMHTGKLIPSNDYGNIVLPYLRQSHLENKPLILSSVGRWHGEEGGVIKALESSDHPLKVVIYLDISNNESHNRWLAREINNDRLNRYDDNEEVLDIRFTEFQEKTIPVIDFYKDMGILITIDGKLTRDEVTDKILDALYEIVISN